MQNAEQNGGIIKSDIKNDYNESIINNNVVLSFMASLREHRLLKKIFIKMLVIYPRLKIRKKNSIIFKIACEYEPFSALNFAGPSFWIDDVPRLQSIKVWLFYESSIYIRYVYTYITNILKTICFNNRGSL